MVSRVTRLRLTDTDVLSALVALPPFPPRGTLALQIARDNAFRVQQCVSDCVHQLLVVALLASSFPLPQAWNTTAPSSEQQQSTNPSCNGYGSSGAASSGSPRLELPNVDVLLCAVKVAVSEAEASGSLALPVVLKTERVS